MRHVAFLALLALSVVGCSDRPSAVGPSGVLPVGVAFSSGAPLPFEDSYISQSCGFNLLVHLSGKVKEIARPGGAFKVSFPGFSTQVTNPATGKQVSIGSTGSFHITGLANGNTEIVYTGRNTYDDPVEGRFLLLIGQFSEVFDSAFDVVQPLHGNGQIVDVCALLS